MLLLRFQYIFHSAASDFRSADGLYSNTKQYCNLPPRWRGEDLFSLQHFRSRPQPLLSLLSALQDTLRGNGDGVTGQPQACHKMLKRLERLGMLQRIYTQNIDGLEGKAGLDATSVVHLHGLLPQGELKQENVEDSIVFYGQVTGLWSHMC